MHEGNERLLSFLRMHDSKFLYQVVCLLWYFTAT